MNSIADTLKNFSLKPQAKSRRTERGDLLSYFLDKMNEHKRAVGKAEWKISSMGYFLSAYSVEQLYLLKRKCDKAKSFAACFCWYVFPKKEPR